MEKPAFKIAIIGFGPKGLYGFERILAHLKANHINQKVEIHLFNKTDFMGSGDVYRSDQPEFLLMNFANKHINIWTEKPPHPVVDYPISLSEFIAHKNQQTIIQIDPLFSSRSVVGAYLENGFNQLCKNIPKNVVLHQHVSEVNSIEKRGSSYSVRYKENDECYISNDFENILITTGHQRHKDLRKSNNKVNFIYPVKEKFKNIHESQTVAIKGMGLTFIDAVLALTEGRGGTFTQKENGNLSYKASGHEPKYIYPFSKSGWPMVPKYNFNQVQEKKLYFHKLKYKKLSKFNFSKDLLPLIKQDMEFAYYHTLFNYENDSLEFNYDYAKINRQINNFHKKNPQYERFSINTLLEPELDHAKSIHHNVLDYLTAFTDEKTLSVAKRAQLQAAAVWRLISPLFNEVYSFSGLEPDSQQEFDQYYFSKFNRIAYGPPPINLKKILAVAEAGFLDFNFAKNPKVEPQEKHFWLRRELSEIQCDILIDARIPKNSIEKEATGLFLNMYKNGLAKPHFNRDDNSIYASGTIEINRKGHLINSMENPEHITLYGTPTEGIVHDNDTLSRKRNNFAEPWAKSIIQQLINRKNDFKQNATGTLSNNNSLDAKINAK